MKTPIFLLIFLVVTVCFAEKPSYEAYLKSIQKVTALVQNISQKLIQESSLVITRSGSSFSTTTYCSKMIEEIKKEVEKITENKNPDQLSQEDKDLIAMLETYIDQLEMMNSSN